MQEVAYCARKVVALGFLRSPSAIASLLRPRFVYWHSLVGNQEEPRMLSLNSPGRSFSRLTTLSLITLVVLTFAVVMPPVWHSRPKAMNKWSPA